MTAESDRPSILIVAAGVMQIPAIKTAKSLGLRVVATDRNPSAPGFALCDESKVLDVKDIEGHVKFALEHRDRLNLKGAFAGADVATTVAAVTTALGLPGIPVDVAERSNNKALMKRRWLEDKIPTPYSEEAVTLAEARAILTRTGLPAIVKAVDNAASRGSAKISSAAELPTAFENAKAASRTHTAIVEQYVIGNEQSVETIVCGGKHHHVGMADRQFGYLPYHIETAHFDPSALDADKQRRIYDVVDAAADSLGITFGPAKADMIWTKDGPMILEMPARLSGGFHSQYTTPLSTGKDPIRAVIEIAVGRPLNEAHITAKWNRVSICGGVFPEAGRIKAVHGVEAAKAIEGVAQVVLAREPGDTIGAYIDNAQRVCWVIVVGDDRAHAASILEQARATIQFEMV